MRILMGISRPKPGGMYVVRKRVPPHLQAAVGRLLRPPKDRAAWLQKSLKTKDPKEANRLAKPVMMQFDALLARAEASIATKPAVTDLSDADVQRIVAYHHAAWLVIAVVTHAVVCGVP